MTKKEATMLVNLHRCTGCWTCSLACKVVNELPDERYWIRVRTLGSGEGIDRPAGTWPDLHMSWMPVWDTACTKCAARIAEGEIPFCAKCCPNDVIVYGEGMEDETERLRGKGFRIFQLPSWESSRDGIVYASKE